MTISRSEQFLAPKLLGLMTLVKPCDEWHTQLSSFSSSLQEEKNVIAPMRATVPTKKNLIFFIIIVINLYITRFFMNLHFTAIGISGNNFVI